MNARGRRQCDPQPNTDLAAPTCALWVHRLDDGDVVLKMSNYPGFPDDPGIPVAITAGFDYRLTHEWLVGAALSAGTTKQTFSLNRGHFTQSEFAASLYAGYLNGPLWTNVIGSVGTLHNDVTRSVPIGITVQQQRHTNGSNSRWRSRPATTSSRSLTRSLAGVLLQQFISMDSPRRQLHQPRFQTSRRNSAVTELGYQAASIPACDVHSPKPPSTTARFHRPSCHSIPNDHRRTGTRCRRWFSADWGRRRNDRKLAPTSRADRAMGNLPNGRRELWRAI